MSDVDRNAPLAAGDDLPTEEGARRWGLDLEEIARLGFADIAAGRVHQGDEVTEQLAIRREVLRALRRGQAIQQPATPPKSVRRA